MTNLEIYKERLAESGWRVFERAVREALRENLSHVSIEQILVGLVHEKTGILHEVMHKLGVDSNLILRLQKERKPREPQRDDGGIVISAKVISLFKLAMDRARTDHRQQIEAIDLFVSLSQDISSPLNEVLRNLNIDQVSLMETVRECAHTHENQDHISKERMVRIKSGPYASFAGKVQGFSEEQPTLSVAISAFGRKILIEINRNDVEEITFTRRQ